MRDKQPRGSNINAERKGLSQKTYLVFLRSNVSTTKQGHEHLIGGFLTRADAEEERDLHPGSYVYKLVVTKAARGGSNVKSS